MSKKARHLIRSPFGSALLGGVIVGLFGWVVVIPPAVGFLTSFNSHEVQYLPQASAYIRFIMLTLISMGLVFQLPVVMMSLGRIGLVSSSGMRRRWRESTVALAAFVLIEGTRIGLTRRWMPIVATCVVGVSLGLPLFLYQRQVHLDRAAA